jgi:GNAT superfamily N-acetyltransferase
MIMDNSQLYSLARRMEMAAWTDVFCQAPYFLQRKLGLGVHTVGRALALRAEHLAHPLFNRAFAGRSSAAELRAIAAHYEEAGTKRYFVHRAHATNDLLPRIAELVPFRRRWVKLAGRLDQAPTPHASEHISIQPARPTDARVCGEIYCAGFEVPMDAADLLAFALELPGWRAFLAKDRAGKNVGVGYLYTSGDAAYLSGATTLPEYRGQGVQRALMAARLNAARDLGLQWVTSETGEDAPGDPQHSLRNMNRFDLRVVGITENLVPRGFDWSHGVVRSQAC